MDKSTRALNMSEDNSERIGIVEKSLRAYVKARTAATVATGTASGGATTFGEFDTGGSPCAAIVAFDGGACELVFGDGAVASGASPLFASLSGAGELKLSGERQNARVMIFGA